MNVADRIAQLETQARARGLTLPRPGAAKPARVAPSVDRKTPHVTPKPPASPIDAATRRPVPMAHAKHLERSRAAAGARDFQEKYRHQDHANMLANVECRLAAWLVCRALGPDWRLEWSDETADTHRLARVLTHGPTGAAFTFRRDWQGEGRYRISPTRTLTRDRLPSITVAATRSPASIAADIRRRIVDAGLAEEHAAACKSERDTRAEEVARRRRVLAVAQAYGGTLTERRCWSSSTYPRGTATHHGVGGETWRDYVTSIVAEQSYSGGVELKIDTQDMGLAIAIAELVRAHHAR